jgi:hypothetical protein
MINIWIIAAYVRDCIPSRLSWQKIPTDEDHLLPFRGTENNPILNVKLDTILCTNNLDYCYDQRHHPFGRGRWKSWSLII